MEAEEHLQTISLNVAAMEKHPDNRDLIQGIRRATHTLKGAAAMMGFHAIADLAHVSEDLLDNIMDGKIVISSAVLSMILDTAEALDMLINAKDGDAVRNDARIQSLHTRYIEILGENVTSMTQQLLEDDLDELMILNRRQVSLLGSRSSSSWWPLRDVQISAFVLAFSVLMSWLICLVNSLSVVAC